MKHVVKDSCKTCKKFSLLFLRKEKPSSINLQLQLHWSRWNRFWRMHKNVVRRMAFQWYHEALYPSSKLLQVKKIDAKRLYVNLNNATVFCFNHEFLYKEKSHYFCVCPSYNRIFYKNLWNQKFNVGQSTV